MVNESATSIIAYLE